MLSDPHGKGTRTQTSFWCRRRALAEFLNHVVHQEVGSNVIRCCLLCLNSKANLKWHLADYAAAG